MKRHNGRVQKLTQVRYIPELNRNLIPLGKLVDLRYTVMMKNRLGGGTEKYRKKDLQLFSDTDNGGKQLLQLFVLRAELELQATSGDNLLQNMACIDSLKSQMGCLFGNSTPKDITVLSEAGKVRHPRSD
ncbi:hypothetical protein AgCh_027641 [Apium graveolens]